MVIASTLASAACGTGIDRLRSSGRWLRKGVAEATRRFGSREDKLPVASAIQVNAVLSDAAASDDSDLRNINHAGTPLTAASLAFAEREGANGEAALAAIVLGYEAAGRIGEAITPGFKDRGFHGCLGAAFASAVASGRLLNLNAEQMAQTIALTAGSIGGLATAADTRVARIPRGSGRDAWRQRGSGGAPRLCR